MSDAQIPGQSPAPKRKRSKTPPAAAASPKPAPKRKPAVKSKSKTVKSKPKSNPAVNLSLDAQERWRLIAEAAYLRAERRGFAEGDPVMDWLEAEQEVDARLKSV